MSLCPALEVLAVCGGVAPSAEAPDEVVDCWEDSGGGDAEPDAVEEDEADSSEGKMVCPD